MLRVRTVLTARSPGGLGRLRSHFAEIAKVREMEWGGRMRIEMGASQMR